MDWQKVLTEFWRIARIAAANIGGAFGALAAVGKPITGNAVLDIMICGVLSAIAYGTSRVSDGSTAFPGVQIKGPHIPKAFLLGLLLTLSVAVPACSMGGCASAQYDARITPQGLAILADDVEEDVNFGIQAAPPEEQDGLRAEAVAFFEAIRSKDAGVIAGAAGPRWGIIKALALNGVDFQIQTDQIGPGVADIHRESVFRFEGLLNRVR